MARVLLPTRTEGAVPRLWASRRVMDDLKTSADTAVTRLLVQTLYTLLPASWARRILRRTTALPSSVILANLAGPEAPLQIGGCTLTALTALLPPPADGWAAVSLLTYSETAHLSVACRGSAADTPARRVLAGIRRQLRMLYSLMKNRRGHQEARQTVLGSEGALAASQPTEQLQEKLAMVQNQLHSLRAESTEQGGADQEGDLFHQRMARLKEEFRDLLAELQRRRSTPDGSTVVYELDNLDGELRRAKKRPGSSRKLSTASSSSISRPLSTAEPVKISSSRSLSSCRSSSPLPVPPGSPEPSQHPVTVTSSQGQVSSCTANLEPFSPPVEHRS